MSDYQFKVGDKGKTRGGGSYEVLSTDGAHIHVGRVQPIFARITGEAGYTTQGDFYPDGKFMDGISASDLMPPEQRSASPELHVALDALLEAKRAEAVAEENRRAALSRRTAAQARFDRALYEATKPTK